MRYTISFLLLLPLVSLTAREAPGADTEEALTPDIVARRLWSIMQVVQEHHVQPPAPSALPAAVMNAARGDGRGGRRFDLVTDEMMWTASLREGWTKQQAENSTVVPAFVARNVGLLATTSGPFNAGFALFSAPSQPTTIEQWHWRLMDAISKAVPGGVGFATERDFKLQEQFKANRYVGTGIQIRMAAEEKLTSIVYCFPGGPARLAGGLSGDLIVEIDGKNMTGCNLREVVDRLRGDEGTPVTMVVRQPGAKETRTLKMVRSVIPFNSVMGYRRKTAEDWDYRVDPTLPIAYVRVDSIRVSTLHELRQVERRLQADGCRALVLDLRFAVSEIEGDHDAALLADALLDNGVLWRVRHRRGQDRELRADSDCLFRGWPLVVLTESLRDNGRGELRGSKGVSLIAAALHDNGRAVLVGTEVRTDPYLHRFHELPSGQGRVQLPTAHVERPKPTPASLELLVEPDQRVTWTAKERQAWFAWRSDQSIERTLDAKPPADPQLDKALEILRTALAAPTTPVRTP